MNDLIYEMKLHDTIELNEKNGYDVIKRVPGGWIYSIASETGAGFSSIFVPYNNEFQGNE